MMWNGEPHEERQRALPLPFVHKSHITNHKSSGGLSGRRNVHLNMPPLALPEPDHTQPAARHVAEDNRQPDVAGVRPRVDSITAQNPSGTMICDTSEM